MAVTLSEKDAREFIYSWEPASDVYAFKYGNGVLTASTVLSALFINLRFRKALKLRKFAFVSTYGAAVFIPTVASTILHGIVVTRPMLTQPVQCPVCLETRSALTQVTCSVVHPLILSPLACIPFADRYMTIAVPSITHQPMLVLKQIFNILRPISKKLLIIAAVQAVIGGALAHFEVSNIITVLEKVDSMEQVVAKTVPEEKMKQLKEAALHEDVEELIKPQTPARKYIFSTE